VFSRKKSPASKDDQAEHEQSLRLIASWAQGLGRTHAESDASVSIAASHQSFCGCLACRVHAGERRARREPFGRLEGAAP
jgi:hypothetical protein